MRNETPQNATVFDELTDVQRLAIEALVSGASATAAAAAVGVDRSTVYRWQKDDFGFQAALSAKRRELHDEINARLLHTARKAVDIVTAAIEAGDVKAALAVLKGIGSLLGQVPALGSDDPETLRVNRKVAESERGRREISSAW